MPSNQLFCDLSAALIGNIGDVDSVRILQQAGHQRILLPLAGPAHLPLAALPPYGLDILVDVVDGRRRVDPKDKSIHRHPGDGREVTVAQPQLGSKRCGEEAV